jgi:hypothetical protein
MYIFRLLVAAVGISECLELAVTPNSLAEGLADGENLMDPADPLITMDPALGRGPPCNYNFRHSSIPIPCNFAPFARSPPSLFNVTARVVPGFPLNGCSEMRPQRGLIVLLERGTCDFGQKALMALNAGAIAVAVIDTKSNSERIISMQTALLQAKNLSIPVVGIPQEKGARLLGLVVNGARCVFTIDSAKSVQQANSPPRLSWAQRPRLKSQDLHRINRLPEQARRCLGALRMQQHYNAQQGVSKEINVPFELSIVHYRKNLRRRELMVLQAESIGAKPNFWDGIDRQDLGSWFEGENGTAQAQICECLPMWWRCIRFIPPANIGRHESFTFTEDVCTSRMHLPPRQQGLAVEWHMDRRKGGGPPAGHLKAHLCQPDAFVANMLAHLVIWFSVVHRQVGHALVSGLSGIALHAYILMFSTDPF